MHTTYIYTTPWFCLHLHLRCLPQIHELHTMWSRSVTSSDTLLGILSSLPLRFGRAGIEIPRVVKGKSKSHATSSVICFWAQTANPSPSLSPPCCFSGMPKHTALERGKWFASLRVYTVIGHSATAPCSASEHEKADRDPCRPENDGDDGCNHHHP